ncbi:hypothetical protein [Streptomyces sp. V3I7]|uniref:hypothetical protein n=1 Tax=Streptomyces sp. V3I7 TaxID=3042278 RepID=UPI00278965D7|nr:hypothetical protein [Streptomyces sp. V3I7]MDQ0991540.1 hypothetical protein [Streptomyces sp. V3I7]
MGIESDQVVYEYLSRVGDVAQQRQLPSATRMRLVSELRNEIDRSRAKATVDSPAAVRRILAGLGTPDEVVAAASGTAAAPQAPAASVPVQPEPPRPAPAKGLQRFVPRPRPAEPSAPAPSPPHLAGQDELGGAHGDWWRVDTTPLGPGENVPGFVGGVEIADLLKPPPPKSDPEEPRREEAPVEAAPEPDAPTRRRRLSLPRPVTGWTNPLLLLAAAALVAGAVLGNWFALLLGWLIAYGSRRLTQAETKLAVMGIPGLAVATGVTWLWGRTEGRWGDPVAAGHMSAALTETWPWMVRGAAVASALFLVWRSQRQR